MAMKKSDRGEMWSPDSSECRSFSRTVWLPRPVDEKGVSAKLSDGILMLTIPKADDKKSVKINVN